MTKRAYFLLLGGVLAIALLGVMLKTANIWRVVTSDDKMTSRGHQTVLQEVDTASKKSVLSSPKSDTEHSSVTPEVNASVEEEQMTKPNPPLSQEVIDRLNYGAAGVKHRLDIAQQVQRTGNTCAPTTVSMMLSSRGITVSQEILAKEMGTDDTFGTHNVNAIRVLNRHLFGYEQPLDHQAGYRLATVTTSDPQSAEMTLFKERLKQNINDGYPMYYTFDNARIYPDGKGEHNVIGTGYQLTEDGTDIAYIYYIDPSYTQQDEQYGGLKKITPEELFDAMLTCVEPNYAW